MKKTLLAIKIFSLLLGIWLFFSSLPFIKGLYKDKSYPRKSIHLLIDISNSMNIKDVKGISRLSQAKNLSQKLISTGENQYSLTIFSSKPNLLIPPTKDIDIFLPYLKSLNSNLLPTSGATNISEALALIDNFASTGDAIIIFSDFDLKVPSTSPLKKNYKTILVGIGSSKPHQVTDINGKAIVYDNRLIKSKRNDTAAKSLASLIGGSYYINSLPVNLINSLSGNNPISYLNYKVLISLILIGLGL